MGVLDKVLQLQSQGMNDPDVIRILREENISPMEINDALNQAKVKSAVISDSNSISQNQFSGMEQSMMQQEDITAPSPESPVQFEQPQEQSFYSAQAQYPQYSPQYSQGFDTETVTEIAEQIVIEKFDEFNQKVGDLVSFKSEVQDKIKDINERVKRIENSIDKIQHAITGKVGEYGDNLNFIKKDLSNIHDTVSKLMNPLIDNYMETRKEKK